MKNDFTFDMFDYENHFWDYVKGKKGAAETISHGRTTETGSYHMPTTTADKYEKAITDESVFRGIASLFSCYDRDSNIIATDNDDVGQFVSAGGSIDVTDLADDFTKVTVGKHKLAALSRISAEFVSDAAFDFEAYFVKRLAQVFARAEDNAFINGSGTNEPTGILHATAGAETGVTTAQIAFDDVVKLFFSVKSKYRKNAVWLMNDSTAMALRKLKDGDGQYLWNNADNTIFGKPVIISEYMPDIAAGAKPIAFGDFSFYWIVKRSPVTVKTLLELFAARNQIGYLAFEFLDGKLIRRDAVKVISVNTDTE
jgi:HK97 family phage major capsid protein